MSFFQTFSIGKRLGACFAIIFSMCLFSSLLGVWQLRQFSSELRSILDESVQTDQTATDLYNLLALGVQRTTAIARSSDPTLADFFAPGIAPAAKRAGELSGRLKALLVRPAEAEAYRKTLPLRDAYYRYRDEIMAFKKAERTADAERLLVERFQPATTAYLEQLRVVVEMQRAKVADSARAIDAQVQSSTRLLIASCVGALGAGLLLAWRLTLSITRPLDRARSLAERVAALDLREAEGGVPSHDEIGALRRALEQMRSQLRETVEHVNTVTDGIATASDEIAVGNRDLSQRTEQAAGNLQQAASTMEELTGTVRQTAGSASTANELAGSAQRSAAKGGSVVSQVTSTMRQIDAASTRIAEIVGVIDGIAFQTNILALNAAVEAARAGDSGRGFAVVASEVRSLAVRSAAAAKEVKSLIGVSVERVAAGTRLVDDAEQVMGEIVGSVRRVSEVIGEIAAAADEQSRGLCQVNGAVAQLDHMTQQNAALVEQSTAATESLKGQAAALAGSVRQFRL